MDTFFWSQNETPTTPDTVGIDGRIYDYKPDPELDNAIHVLMDSSFGRSFKRKEFSSSVVNYDVPNNFMLVWNSNGLLIQSTFQNLDEGGAPLTYRFWSKDKSLEIACNALEQYALSAGRDLRNNEIENIKKIGELINEKINSKRKKIFFFVVLIISLILMLTILWKNYYMDK